MEYSTEKNADGTYLSFAIDIPSGNYALYGNLPYSYSYDGVIKSGDTQLTEYAKWGSPSVFYIPSSDGMDSVNVEVMSNSGKAISNENPQFYALDLDAMKLVSDSLKQKSVNSLVIDGNSITIDAQLEENEAIFTSIAYDKGWMITDNGVDIAPDLYENCLMTFKLGAGEHHIELKYKQPGKILGIIFSIAGCFLLALWYYQLNKNHKVKV